MRSNEGCEITGMTVIMLNPSVKKQMCRLRQNHVSPYAQDNTRNQQCV